MPSCSRIERARPLLGTVTRIRVEGLAEHVALEAIEAAFAEVARVHALMSFHESASDVSLLNNRAHQEAMRVDARTFTVLSRALTLSKCSNGLFDITIAPELVERGYLPRLESVDAPDADVSWRDIELLPDCFVRLKRPLWIDLGGIAKGYAVDRAIEALAVFAPAKAVVNAGGDLRVIGDEPERVMLTHDHFDEEAIPVLDVAGCAVASSSGDAHVATHGQRPVANHFVSVIAACCMDADALTKVVMARGACCLPILNAWNARAVFYDAAYGWRQIGCA